MNFLLTVDVMTLSLIMISSGISKLLKFNEHIIYLNAYNIIPPKLSKLTLSLLLLMEILIGTFLIIGQQLVVAGIVQIIVLLIYEFSISLNLIRGNNEISCGCGGLLGNHRLSWLLFARNVVLIFMALVIISFNSEIASILSHSFRSANLVLSNFITPVIVSLCILITYNILMSINEMKIKFEVK